ERIEEKKIFPFFNSFFIVKKKLLFNLLKTITTIMKDVTGNVEGGFYSIYQEMMVFYFCYGFNGRKYSVGGKGFVYYPIYSFYNDILSVPLEKDHPIIEKLEFDD